MTEEPNDFGYAARQKLLNTPITTPMKFVHSARPFAPMTGLDVLAALGISADTEDNRVWSERERDTEAETAICSLFAYNVFPRAYIGGREGLDPVLFSLDYPSELEEALGTQRLKEMMLAEVKKILGLAVSLQPHAAIWFDPPQIQRLPAGSLRFYARAAFVPKQKFENMLPEMKP